MATRRICCSSCCRSCGSHFSTDTAFDAHRAGPIDGRHCVEPADVIGRNGRAKLAPRTMSGVCRLTGQERIGVTVWTLARTVGDQQRLSGLRLSA